MVFIIPVKLTILGFFVFVFCKHPKSI